LSSSRRLPAHATSNFTWWRRLSCNRSARVRRGPTSRSRQEVRRDVRTHRQKPGKGSWDRNRASSTETPPSRCGPRRDFDRHREAARRCRGGAGLRDRVGVSSGPSMRPRCKRTPRNRRHGEWRGSFIACISS
jgi:hypothetical protein